MLRRSWMGGGVRCLVRFEHALLAKVREQLSSGNVFQEHVQLPTVLGEPFEGDLRGLCGTMNGCVSELRILYSLAMWSTCCDLMSSSLRMIFTQEYLPVAFRLTSRTRPNDPE